MIKQLQTYKHQMQLFATKLDALSPLKRLSSGYAFVENNGNVVNTACQVSEGDFLQIYLKDGKIETRVVGVFKDE